MLKTIIIDDKPGNISTLRKLLEQHCPQITVCATALNIEDAEQAIARFQPILIFLDIEMPNGSGFDLLKRFDALTFEIIFTTAYNQYAVQAFRENALDYLLKPIDIGALQEAVTKVEKQVSLKQANTYHEKYLKQLQPQTTKISIPVHDGYLFINHQDIIRCEASGSYSNFFTIDGKKQIVSMRLKECEDILPVNTFFRVHYSHIINLKHITRYVRGRGGYVLMQDGSTVEVAASKKDAFLTQLKQGF